MYTTKEHYLAALRRVCKRLPAQDNRIKREAFRESALFKSFDPYIAHGVGMYVTGKWVYSDESAEDLNGSMRDNLAWHLAQLKYDGVIPEPHIMKLASLFNITRREIDEHREYCSSQLAWGCGLNQPMSELPVSPSAQVIPFPADRILRCVEPIRAA